MGDRLPNATVKGVAVLAPEWTPLRIHEADTSLTEADPQPGTASTTEADARIIPQVVGVQLVAAKLVVTQSGNPGLGMPSRLVTIGSYGTTNLEDAHRAEVGYYLDDGVETEDDIRGLDVPTKITEWRAPGAINAPDMADAVTLPLSGKVALMWRAALGVRFAIWNPYDSSFENTQTLPGALDDYLTLAAVPGTERLLALGVSKAAYSDDYGANWSSYTTRGPGTVAPTPPDVDYTGKIRSAFDGQGNCLWMATDLADGTVHSFASSDLGVSWSYIDSTASLTDWDLAQHPDGSLYVAYIDASDHVLVARLTGAYGVLEDATGVHAFGDEYTALEYTATQCWIGIDWNGFIWVYAEDATNAGYWRVAVSYDGGLSFVERIIYPLIPAPYFWALGAGADGPGAWRLVPNAAGGLIASACFGDIGAGTEQGGMAKLGGWTSPQPLSLLFAKNTVPFDITDRHWVGYARPEDIASTPWTKVGAATTTHSSADGSPINPQGYVKIDSGAGAIAGYYLGTLGDNGFRTVRGYFCLQIESDGGADDVIGVRYEMDDTTGNVYALFAIFFTETGFRVRDVNAGTWFGLEVAHDMTERTHIHIGANPDDSSVEILYRHDGEVKWNVRTYAVSFSAATNTTDQASVGWGHLDTGGTNAISRWWYSQHEAAPANLTDTEVGVTSETGLSVHGVCATSEHPYPLPELHDTTNERMAMVLLRGGVGVRGETYAHDVLPGYPREAVFPMTEPSATRRWRSTGVGSNQVWAVDRGYDGRPLGEQSLVLAVMGANARQWRLEYKADGGGGYTTLGTLDLATGFASVGFTRYGQVIVPASGGAGNRYLWAGETAGGHVVLDLAGTPVAARLQTNTPGFWDAAATGPRATLVLEDGFDNGTLPSSGLMSIVWPAGVMPLHGAGTSTTFRRYWKVSCLSTNKSPDGYFEAGILGLFALKPTGKQWGNGWEWSHEPNTRGSRDSYGTERRDQLGPERRVLTRSWDHGFKLSRIRGQTDADYVGASGGAALVARDDVWQVSADLWQQSEGGSRPCIVLLDDPGNGNTLTDRTLWMYCYLDGSLRAQHAIGGENTAEFMRSGPDRLVEIL